MPVSTAHTCSYSCMRRVLGAMGVCSSPQWCHLIQCNCTASSSCDYLCISCSVGTCALHRAQARQYTRAAPALTLCLETICCAGLDVLTVLPPTSNPKFMQYTSASGVHHPPQWCSLQRMPGHELRAGGVLGLPCLSCTPQVVRRRPRCCCRRCCRFCCQQDQKQGRTSDL